MAKFGSKIKEKHESMVFLKQRVNSVDSLCLQFTYTSYGLHRGEGKEETRGLVLIPYCYSNSNLCSLNPLDLS